ncbi:DUF4129 domain-containing protein [Gorillibacterium sp. sgz5001074]|uniref:DUF4129 domain-containing protein n=1 Tax=Gorillibacterium sp. sgz5001074 TaxID=3446695 RepID=UPI003F6641E6
MKPYEGPGWKARWRRGAIAVTNGWLELFTASPILVLVVGFWMGDDPTGWLWIAGLAGYTLWSAAIASARYLRWTGVLVVCNTAAILGWAWLLHGLSVKALLSALFGIAAAVRATQVARYGDAVRMPPFVLWMGLGACAPSIFLVHRSLQLDGFGDGLQWIGIGLFLAAVFLSNGSALKDATYGGRHVSAYGAKMRRFNRLLVTGFALTVAAVSFWGLIDAAARWVGRQLARLLGALLPDEGPPPEVKPSATPQPQGQEQMLPPGGKPAWIWVVLERILMVAFILAAAVLAVYLLRLVIRRLPGWLRAAGAWLAKYRRGQPEPEDAGYVDEVSSTRDGRRDIGPWARLKRILRPEPGIRWEDLRTNGERIRYLYAQAVRRSVKAGLRWRAQWTPSETAAEAAKAQAGSPLAAGLSEAYERARYGAAEPDDAETARWKRQVEG